MLGCSRREAPRSDGGAGRTCTTASTPKQGPGHGMAAQGSGESWARGRVVDSWPRRGAGALGRACWGSGWGSGDQARVTMVLKGCTGLASRSSKGRTGNCTAAARDCRSPTSGHGGMAAESVLVCAETRARDCSSDFSCNTASFCQGQQEDANIWRQR